MSQGAILGGTWSLAIEEQFYMVWPLVVFFTRRRRLQDLALTVVLVMPFLRLGAQLSGVSTDYIYAATPYRLDGLAFGAIIACMVRSKTFDVRWLSIGGPIAAVLGVAGFA